MKSINKNLNAQIALRIFYFILIILFLRIDLVLQNNTPTGGDMGAHIVGVSYFIKNFAPNFEINGWSNDWFAGYPLYYFYFPLPAIFTYLINLILPFGISFKIMVALSIFIMSYSIEKLLRTKDVKFSIYGAAAGLLYIFTESFTIYGGNLASTLAGQYSFTFALAFGNLSIFYMIKSKNRFQLPISSIFLGFCLLSHLIPFLIYAPVFGFYWLFKKNNVRIRLLSLLIFSTIVLRFLTGLVTNLEYTTNMSYTPFSKIEDLIKADILPLLFVIFIFLSNLIRKEFIENRLNIFIIYLIGISIFLYFFVPEGALWNGRLVPFFNLGVVLMFFQTSKLIIKNLYLYQQGSNNLKFIFFVSTLLCLYLFYENWSENQNYLNMYIPIIVLIIIFAILYINNLSIQFSLLLFSLVFSSVSFLPHWINWNFSGYENKQDWKEIEKLYEGLKSLPPGRIMWEPNSEMNKYGTPMALMTIPYFTQHTSMEGLYFDSSITTPFHFIAVSGLAKKPSNPVGGLSYINNDFEKGVDYLYELGVDYFISYTKEIENKSLNSDKMVLLFTTEPFSVFKINSLKVELIDEDIEIFRKVSKQDGIISSIFRNTDIENFFEKSYKNFGSLDKRRIVEINNLITISSANAKNLIIEDLKITNERISFVTNNPGELHLIKVSYFPNWKLNDGLGPFRTSPSFMSIVPNRNYVEINFEKTPLERNTFYFSLFSLLLSLTIFISLKKNAKKI